MNSERYLGSGNEGREEGSGLDAVLADRTCLFCDGKREREMEVKGASKLHMFSFPYPLKHYCQKKLQAYN